MQPYSALIDVENNVVLIASTHISIIVFLNECMENTFHCPLVNSPHYENVFPLAAIPPEEYPQWSWDWKSRLFNKTTAAVTNTALTQKAVLASAKHAILKRLILNLSSMRYKVRTGVEFQETVYLTKTMQAERFKESGYDTSQLIEFPYVVQYADFAGIPIAQAADDILFKAHLDDDYLARSEMLRLKYFKAIAEATKDRGFFYAH